MSKASQRRLAEQQKKSKKLGLPKNDDLMQVLYHREDAIYETPLAFWRCMAAAIGTGAAKRKKHPDDERLEAFFQESRIDIERLHDAAIQAEMLGADAVDLPGIALHGFVDPKRIYDAAMWPLAVNRFTPIETAEAMVEVLNDDRRRSEHGFDASLWIFGLPLPGEPLVCLGVSETGAQFVRMKVEGEWLIGRDDRLLTLALGKYHHETDGFDENSLAAGGVMKAMSKLLDWQPEELYDKLTTEFTDEIGISFDEAATPYLNLALGALEYVRSIKHVADRTVHQQRERAEELESLHRKATTELRSVKKHLASTLNAQQRRAPSPPPLQEKPQPGSTKIHEPSPLATRLAAFF